MSVACCPLSGNDESSTGTSEIIRAARKAHECVECHEAIPVGASYERYTVFDDGSAEAYKTCLSCVEIRNHFACNGWLFGCVWEDLENSFFETMVAGGPCMQGLSPAAKDRLFTRRTAWLGSDVGRKVMRRRNDRALMNAKYAAERPAVADGVFYTGTTTEDM